jgi:hypothetical protein
MAAKRKAPSEPETLRMPTPGTLSHLEFLRELEVEDKSHLSDPSVFLIETMAATSLARVIRRHRTYWPMRNMQTADLDSRLLALGQERTGRLYGSIGLRTYWPSHNHLSVFGQSESGNSYDLVIPVTRAYIYDSGRPVQAKYQREDSEPWIYNEIAAPEYHEDNPRAVIGAVREAADDLLDIFHYIYGQGQETSGLQLYPAVEVAWHPDYLSDDPDEFLKKAT